MAANETIEAMKSMMRSIYAYGTLQSDNRYLDSYRNRLTVKEFETTFNEHAKYLSDNFTRRYAVYTDSEGCTYNELVRINE